MKKFEVLTYALKNKSIDLFLYAVIIFVISALSIQLGFVILNFGGKENITNQVSNLFYRNFDNTYKYSATFDTTVDKTIHIESVSNQIKVGKLSGNHNMEFGVRNIMEEFLQDKGFSINENSKYSLKIEIVYLDVLNTKKNISIVHEDKDEVVIRIKGTLYENGNKIKNYVSEESSSEIIMSTLIVGENGSFNQVSLSNAIKKSCDKLINKLF